MENDPGSVLRGEYGANWPKCGIFVNCGRKIRHSALAASAASR
jgi:hypothetical protein